MTTNNQLTFQPGKFYKTRDGRKARIYATDAGTPWTIHGALLHLSQWISTVWQDQGKYLLTGDNSADLIAEWIDAPSVDWSKMPEGTAAVFQNGSQGKWVAATNIPSLGEVSFRGSACGKWFELYPQHVPKWSGDWRESLVTRPTEETK